MLTEKQTHLVREAIREKVHNLSILIEQENAKSLREQNIKQIDRLIIDHNNYEAIYDELLRVGC
ncbi:hypothetical protein ACYSNR_02080 [Enterococcus sp. LJL128]